MTDMIEKAQKEEAVVEVVTDEALEKAASLREQYGPSATCNHTPIPCLDSL